MKPNVPFVLPPHNLKTHVYFKGHIMHMLLIYLNLNHKNIVMQDLFDA